MKDTKPPAPKTPGTSRCSSKQSRAKKASGLRRSTHLWVLVYLLSILLVAVDVETHGGARAAGAAQPEDDAGAVGEDEPQALLGDTGGKNLSAQGVFHDSQPDLHHLSSLGSTEGSCVTLSPLPQGFMEIREQEPARHSIPSPVLSMETWSKHSRRPCPPGSWRRCHPRGRCTRSCRLSPPCTPCPRSRAASPRRSGRTSPPPNPSSSCWQHLHPPPRSRTCSQQHTQD